MFRGLYCILVFISFIGNLEENVNSQWLSIILLLLILLSLYHFHFLSWFSTFLQCPFLKFPFNSLCWTHSFIQFSFILWFFSVAPKFNQLLLHFLCFDQFVCNYFCFRLLLLLLLLLIFITYTQVLIWECKIQLGVLYYSFNQHKILYLCFLIFTQAFI
jgi:hypothetical protein